MQLIPVFKIGILNAWIFILLVLLPLLLVGIFRRKVLKKQILFMLLFLLQGRKRFSFSQR